MITLSRHIEVLLLEHDCVIIPGLGGFIANIAPSRYSDIGDNLFLPPYRTIGFNKELTVNDGLLVQSYMQAYDAAYPEAYLQMEKDINEMLGQLDSLGSYTFNGVGTLSKNLDEGISFSGFESGLLTPELYGLYSFEFKGIEEARKEKEIQIALSQTSILPVQTETEISTAGTSIVTTPEAGQPDASGTNDRSEDEKEKDKSSIVIRLPKRWAEFSAAVAAAVILLFLFTYPSLKSEEEMSDTCVASTVFVGNPSDLNAMPVQGKREPVATTTKTNTNGNTAESLVNSGGGRSEKNNIQDKARKNEEGGYVIVLASCVGEKNANIFISNLEDEGLHEARYVKGEKNRIVYSSYKTEKDAYEALRQLRGESVFFKDAWILNMN